MCAIICNKSLSFRRTRHHSPHEFVEKRRREIGDAAARAVNHALLEQRGAQLRKPPRTFDVLQVRVLTKSACNPHKQRILRISKNCAGSERHLTLPPSDNCAGGVPAGVSGNGRLPRRDTGRRRKSHVRSRPNRTRPPIARKSHPVADELPLFTHKRNDSRAPPRLRRDFPDQPHKNHKNIVHGFFSAYERFAELRRMLRKFHLKEKPLVPKSAMVRTNVSHVAEHVHEGTHPLCVQTPTVKNLISRGAVVQAIYHREQLPLRENFAHRPDRHAFRRSEVVPKMRDARLFRSNNRLANSMKRLPIRRTGMNLRVLIRESAVFQPQDMRPSRTQRRFHTFDCVQSRETQPPVEHVESPKVFK